MPVPQRPAPTPLMAHPEAGWHPEDIRAAIRKRYGSLRALSLRFGMDRTAVSIVLLRPTASTRLERLIAAAIDQTPHALWPDRWSKGGEPLPRTGLPKAAPRWPRNSSQKRHAA